MYIRQDGLFWSQNWSKNCKIIYMIVPADHNDGTDFPKAPIPPSVRPLNGYDGFWVWKVRQIGAIVVIGPDKLNDRVMLCNVTWDLATSWSILTQAVNLKKKLREVLESWKARPRSMHRCSFVQWYRFNM